MAERVHSVLIVGVGSIGERHTRCFQKTGRANLSICETNEALCATIADRYSIVRSYPTLDAAMPDRHEIAVICTPAPLHIPMAQRLADAGTHLLIEKPLSTTLDGIEQLSQTIARNNLTVAVAYVYRAHPMLAQLREALLSGRFGRIVQIVATCGQNFPTYRPAYRNTYYTRHETGGGAIQDALTHVINAAEWIAGPVTRLAADAQHCILDGTDVEDTVHVLARHGAIMASYSLNQHQAPNEITLTFICERGTARMEMHNQRWCWMTKPDEPWHDEPAPIPERDTTFIAQANAFLDAVDGKSPALCTLDEALQTLKVNLAALEAWRRGRWIELE